MRGSPTLYTINPQPGLKIAQLLLGAKEEDERLKVTVDPLILEGTDDAPTEEGDDAVADVLLSQLLEVTEVGCKGGSLVVGSEQSPNLLLRCDKLHTSV